MWRRAIVRLDCSPMEHCRMWDALIALELLLWQGGAEVQRRYVLEDAVIVLGKQEALSRDAAIELLDRMKAEGQHPSNVSFQDVQCVELDSNAIIISYRVNSTADDVDKLFSAQCKSLYLRRNGKFRLAFHELITG